MHIETLAAAKALPPGRLELLVNEKEILLYSIQRLEVLEALTNEGHCKPCINNSDMFAEYRVPYEWMSEQVTRRTGIKTEPGAVFWGWAWRTRQDLAYSIKHAADFAKEQYSEVLLTLKMPTPLVLLSDFSTWHEPLNYWPCETPEQQLEAEAAWDKDEDWYHPIIRMVEARGDRYDLDNLPKHEQQLVKDTWVNCLVDMKDLPKRQRGNAVQACFPEIRAEHVMRAVILK
jgi:hypothetical protein